MTDMTPDSQVENSSAQPSPRRPLHQAALNGVVALVLCCILGVIIAIAWQKANPEALGSLSAKIGMLLAAITFFVSLAWLTKHRVVAMLIAVGFVGFVGLVIVYAVQDSEVGAAAFDAAATSASAEFTIEDGHPVLLHRALGIRVEAPCDAMEPAGSKVLENHKYMWSFVNPQEHEVVTLYASRDRLTTKDALGMFTDGLLRGMHNTADPRGVEIRVTSRTIDELNRIADLSGSVGPGYFSARVIFQGSGHFHPITAAVQAYSRNADHAAATAKSLRLSDPLD